MRLLPLAVVVSLTACTPKPPAPKPGPLQAGVATVPLDAPVGVPMGGYSRTRKNGEPGSAFADRLPASHGVQTTPTARAIALTDGLTKIVLVRLDACLTTNSLRFAAEQKLHERGYDGATLLVTSTHTHHGPARYFRPAPTQGGGSFDPTALAMDTWDVELEQRLAGSIADAAAKALDGLKPASVGVATVEAGQFNHDRRCENDDLYPVGYRDQTLTVVRIDEVDEQGNPVRPLTGLINYAVHGTVLGSDNDLLSVDAPGAIELFGSDAVGAPLLYLQGSAGDVSPDTGPVGHGAFQGVERIGRLVAPLVADAYARALPPTRPAAATLQRFERPVDLSRAAIGYAPGEFSEYGGIGCGLGGGACPPMPTAPSAVICVPMKKRPFNQTTVVALRLESVFIGSLPGEPTTAIGERVKKLSEGMSGITHHLVAGYAQDHYGYILEEPDYLRLGYEPSVSPWGWKFGDFIVAQLGEAVASVGQPEPTHLLPEAMTGAPRAATDSTSAPATAGAVADLDRLGTAVFAFTGGDPTLGTPEVFLEKQEGAGFVAVMASPLRKVSGGPDLVLRYAETPTFAAEPTATAREHRWTAEWETLPDTPAGSYRLVAKGRAKLGGAETPYELTSNTFAVAAAKSAGTGASAELAADGTLSVRLRFPPNPPLEDGDGAPIGNYRLRDAFSSPQEGALAQGGAATATVTLPNGMTQPVTLTWDATARAHLAKNVTALVGGYHVVIAAQGFTDGAGNTNAAALDVAFTR